MDILSKALSHHDRDASTFRINNLFAWHVKADRQEAVSEARRKLWVRGMVERWYIAPVLDDEECDLVEKNMPGIIKAYVANSPVIEGIPNAIVDKLVDELTFTGDLGDVDELIERFWTFKDAGVNEMGLRLYGEPADSIRLIAETIGAELM